MNARSMPPRRGNANRPAATMAGVDDRRSPSSLSLLLRPSGAARSDAGPALCPRARRRWHADVASDVRAGDEAPLDGRRDGAMARAAPGRGDRLARAAVPQTPFAGGHVVRRSAGSDPRRATGAPPGHRPSPWAQPRRGRNGGAGKAVDRCPLDLRCSRSSRGGIRRLRELAEGRAPVQAHQGCRTLAVPLGRRVRRAHGTDASAAARTDGRAAGGDDSLLRRRVASRAGRSRRFASGARCVRPDRVRLPRHSGRLLHGRRGGGAVRRGAGARSARVPAGPDAIVAGTARGRTPASRRPCRFVSRPRKQPR